MKKDRNREKMTRRKQGEIFTGGKGKKKGSENGRKGHKSMIRFVYHFPLQARKFHSHTHLAVIEINGGALGGAEDRMHLGIEHVKALL